MTRDLPEPDLDTLAMEPTLPTTIGTRSPDDPHEILLDDEEASMIFGDDDFMSIINGDKGDEEIEDEE